MTVSFLLLRLLLLLLLFILLLLVELDVAVSAVPGVNDETNEL